MTLGLTATITDDDCGRKRFCSASHEAKHKKSAAREVRCEDGVCCGSSLSRDTATFQ
jgi:hypothetical protein